MRTPQRHGRSTRRPRAPAPHQTASLQLDPDSLGSSGATMPASITFLDGSKEQAPPTTIHVRPELAAPPVAGPSAKILSQGSWGICSEPAAAVRAERPRAWHLLRDAGHGLPARTP